MWMPWLPMGGLATGTALTGACTIHSASSHAFVVLYPRGRRARPYESVLRWSSHQSMARHIAAAEVRQQDVHCPALERRCATLTSQIAVPAAGIPLNLCKLQLLQGA